MDRGARLRRAERLRDSRDYRRVNARARRAASANFVVLVSQQPSTEQVEPGPRLGITASRRVGGAVVRNRVKRRIREWFRHSDRAAASQLDIVVIARGGATKLDQRGVAAELDALLAEVARS